MKDTNFSKKPGFYHSVIESVEKPLIEKSLERTSGNQYKAAKLLGINRNTLRTKIKKLGIEVDRWKY
jgi:two-component system nitrogen regulation response regulator GlnG